MAKSFELPRCLNPGDGVKVQLGPLTIDVTDLCLGKVRFHGKRLPVRGFTIEAKINEPIRLTLDYATGYSADELEVDPSQSVDVLDLHGRLCEGK